MFFRALTLLVILAFAIVPASAEGPDTIFLHGRILTGAHLLPDRQDSSKTAAIVSALAVKDGVILAAGSDAEISRMQSKATRMVDLKGAFAMPGFNDAHVHLWSAGAQKALSVDLDHVRSLAEMQQRIRAFIKRSGGTPGTWLQGAGWDHTVWPTKSLPGRRDLDAVTTSHPAIFYRTDGHILVANSAALAAAGITSATPDPPGAQILRDASGVPTGILKEAAAMRLVENIIPQPSARQRRRAILTAIHDALSCGVTSVQDYSPDPENFAAMETLERNHELRLRISEWQDFNLPVATLESRRNHHDSGDPLLHYSMLKGFMDGSLGSRTASLAAPYSDEPSNSGLPRYDQQQLNKTARERAAAGFQLGFHAIGDQANHAALEALAIAETGGGPSASTANRPSTSGRSSPSALRFRIEHAQVLLPGDFARFHQLGVIASMQPSHLLSDMNWAENRLGPERSRYAYAWKSFLDAGVPLAFGTDYPVEAITPFRGLYAATTRRNEAGTQTFQPEETISIQQAIYAYTQGSAFAGFQEDHLGRLEPGYLADFVVLDQDLMQVPATALLHTQVLRTVVNGETVYLRSGAKAPSGQ